MKCSLNHTLITSYQRNTRNLVRFIANFLVISILHWSCLETVAYMQNNTFNTQTTFFSLFEQVKPYIQWSFLIFLVDFTLKILIDVCFGIYRIYYYYCYYYFRHYYSFILDYFFRMEFFKTKPWYFPIFVYKSYNIHFTCCWFPLYLKSSWTI